MRWDLTDIYPSLDSEAFRADAARLTKLADDLNQWCRTGLVGDPADVLTAAVERLSQYRLLSERLIAYCYLLTAVNADDTAAQSWIEKFSGVDAEAVQGLTLFRQYLLSLGDALDTAIASRKELAEFSFILRENRALAKYMLSADVEKALSLMEITGSQAWSTLHNTLTSTVAAELEQGGETKKLTLSMVRNLAYDADPEIRRKAYEAELACYPAIEKSAAAALNGIKGESITKCRLRGFDSPLDKVLFESRMDRRTLDAMVGAMEEYLPVMRRYMKAKARLLGRESLPFYDLFAPIGEITKTYTLEEARRYLVESFAAFSPKMSGFIDTAFEQNWLDTEPRAGKQGGAFCYTVHAVGQPRILSNFNGSFSAVTTLAHELGHAYHGLCLKDRNVLNVEYPMPLAETASIFNETFIFNQALEGAANASERLTLLDEQLKDMNQVITDILSRYYFETAVFERRADGLPDAGEFSALMLDAQRRAYGDGLDASLLHPYMWICKGHYYMGINFYNFPYAFGLLFGLGVYAQYVQKGKAFLPVYDELLASTGSNSIADVCASVGIDVRDRAFWRQSLEIVRAKAEQFEELAGKV